MHISDWADDFQHEHIEDMWTGGECVCVILCHDSQGERRTAVVAM